MILHNEVTERKKVLQNDLKIYKYIAMIQL